MFNYVKPLRRRCNIRLVWIAGISLTFAAVIAISSTAVLTTAKNERVTGAREPINRLSPTNSTRQRIEGEIVSLQLTGCEPKRITHSARPFLLVINNYTGLSVNPVLLNVDSGIPLRTISLVRDKRVWSDFVDLPPGNYTLSEATQPNLACQITIR
jgi:hypothetical protein